MKSEKNDYVDVGLSDRDTATHARTGMEISQASDSDDSENDLNYDQKRLKMKFGLWKSLIMIFQSTVGIGWFTLHQPLAKVGIYLGFAVILFSGYITVYGLLLLEQTASLAEKDHQREHKIKNVDELCNLIPSPKIQIMKWIMLFSSVGMIVASSVSNICIFGSLF